MVEKNLENSEITILTTEPAALGLFGLATYTVERRTKEIGIRKVLGATVSEIISLFCKNLLKWLMISIMIAWPIAYIAMNKWLQNFAYHVNIEFSTFFISGLLVFGTAFFSIGYQTVKAALANPVNALRYE